MKHIEFLKKMSKSLDPNGGACVGVGRRSLFDVVARGRRGGERVEGGGGRTR
jgi:hypothetical protein